MGDFSVRVKLQSGIDAADIFAYHHGDTRYRSFLGSCRYNGCRFLSQQPYGENGFSSAWYHFAVSETKPEVEVCLLFGSAAKGKSGANSDIDIAICGDKAFTHDYLAELQVAIAERLGTEVDLLDMARLNCTKHMKDFREYAAGVLEYYNID